MFSLFTSFMDLLYPPRCLHCYSNDVESPRPLCGVCAEQLILLTADGRCRRCFNTFSQKGLCFECRKRPTILRQSAAAFSYEGAAVTLVKNLKYGSLDYLAKGMGALMSAQILSLNWPWPDFIIPVPMAATHLITRGFNQSFLLAESIGQVLERPVCEAIGRYCGDYSQAGLSREQRQALNSRHFVLKEKNSLAGKRLLLVDDVLTTGQTLLCCADILAEAEPAVINAITFCRTE